MRITFKIGMNRTGQGGKFHCDLTLMVQAENEFMATKEAEKRHPNLKVCFVERM